MISQRRPIVAGQFYPADKSQLLQALKECLTGGLPVDLPEVVQGAILPHAGWVFSGQLAGKGFSSIKFTNNKVDTFVLFGAAHRPVKQAAVYDNGLWQTPLGIIEIDEALAEQIISQTTSAIANKEAHDSEHSIEVLVPFIQYLFPEAKILPVITPAREDAVEVGRVVGKIMAENRGNKNIICIGSTDLTHYGIDYGLVGYDADMVEWVKENDASFIANATKLRPTELLNDALVKGNACGPGAAAATVETMRQVGKTKGLLVGYSQSAEIMQDKFGQSSDSSVGYAAIIY